VCRERLYISERRAVCVCCHRVKETPMKMSGQQIDEWREFLLELSQTSAQIDPLPRNLEERGQHEPPPQQQQQLRGATGVPWDDGLARASRHERAEAARGSPSPQTLQPQTRGPVSGSSLSGSSINFTPPVTPLAPCQGISVPSPAATPPSATKARTPDAAAMPVHETVTGAVAAPVTALNSSTFSTSSATSRQREASPPAAAARQMPEAARGKLEAAAAEGRDVLRPTSVAALELPRLEDTIIDAAFADAPDTALKSLTSIKTSTSFDPDQLHFEPSPSPSPQGQATADAGRYVGADAALQADGGGGGGGGGGGAAAGGRQVPPQDCSAAVGWEIRARP